MTLKGGMAYLDMHGYDIHVPITQEDAVYIKDIYKEALKAVKSKKPIVIYNAGSALSNMSTVVEGYNIVPTDNTIAIKFSYVSTAGGSFGRRLYINTNDKYYIVVV